MAQRTADTPSLDSIEISSLAAPTEADLALFARLTPEQRRALVTRELARGLEGEAVVADPDAIWREAVARAKQSGDGL